MTPDLRHPDLRLSGAISAGLHVTILLALLFTLKPAVPPPANDTAVTMEFSTAPGEVQRAQNPALMPAPSPAEVPTPDLPSVEPPKPVPTETAAPPPPPPLAPPPATMAAPVPTPPIPPPPQQQSAPAIPLTATPAPLATAEVPLPVPPVPPPPAPVPSKPAPQAAPPTPKVEPRPPAPKPAPERPTPTQRTTSTTNQQNPTKNTAEDSKTLEATLERLRSLQAQNKAPTRAYNPPRGGAPGGGNPNGVDNAKLSGADRGAIGDRIRECWTRDAGARDADKMSAVLQVVTDGSGTVRDAKIVTPGQGPGGLAFAERAKRAALDPQCNPIPLPKGLLGQTHTFEINFKP